VARSRTAYHHCIVIKTKADNLKDRVSKYYPISTARRDEDAFTISFSSFQTITISRITVVGVADAVRCINGTL